MKHKRLYNFDRLEFTKTRPLPEGKRRCRYCNKIFEACEVGVHEREHPPNSYWSKEAGCYIETRGY